MKSDGLEHVESLRSFYNAQNVPVGELIELGQMLIDGDVIHVDEVKQQVGGEAKTLKLHDALKALNEAAYAAIRAGADTIMHPVDRQTLREIAAKTDALVDDNAPRITPTTETTS